MNLALFYYQEHIKAYKAVIWKCGKVHKYLSPALASSPQPHTSSQVNTFTHPLCYAHTLNTQKNKNEIYFTWTVGELEYDLYSVFRIT